MMGCGAIEKYISINPRMITSASHDLLANSALVSRVARYRVPNGEHSLLIAAW